MIAEEKCSDFSLQELFGQLWNVNEQVFDDFSMLNSYNIALCINHSTMILMVACFVEGSAW